MNTDEQSIAIVSFTGAIKREIVRAKKKLARDESMASFKITIEASGRMDGDTRIEFSVADNDWGSSIVKSHCLNAAIDELLRRRGWEELNQPLMLTANEQQRADADRVYTNQEEKQ